MFSSTNPDYSQLCDAGISTTASLETPSPTISSADLPCDNFLKLLSNSAVDTSRIWKSGVASVQLLVPTAPAPAFLGSSSRSPAAAAGMHAPTSKPIRRPKNSYQLFCEDWRPCLKSLTHIPKTGDAYLLEREHILEEISDEAVREALATAPSDATLSALLGLAWKNLPAEEKQRYENEGEELMRQFKKDHLNWRELLRSPMLAFGGSVKKRKRSPPQQGNQEQQQLRPIPAPTPTPVVHPSTNPVCEDSENDQSDDDGEYQDPSVVRATKRRASSNSKQAPAVAPASSSIKMEIMEPVSIAVTAATRNTIRQSDWAHLYNSLLSANQTMNRFVTGGSA